MSFKHWIRTVYLILLFGISALLTERFCRRQTDGFALSKMRSNLFFHSEWEVASLFPSEQEKVLSLLDQKYHYYAKGAQCYVFLSKDQNYVLKFFRHDHMRPSPWLSLLPPFFASYREKI